MALEELDSRTRLISRMWRSLAVAFGGHSSLNLTHDPGMGQTSMIAPDFADRVVKLFFGVECRVASIVSVVGDISLSRFETQYHGSTCPCYLGK